MQTRGVIGPPEMAVLSSSALSRDTLCGLSNVILPLCQNLKCLVVQDDGLLTHSLDNLRNLEDLTLRQRSACSHFVDDQMRAGMRLPSLQNLTLYLEHLNSSSDDAQDICTARGIQLKTDSYLPIMFGLNVSWEMSAAFMRHLPSTKAMLFDEAR